MSHEQLCRPPFAHAPQAAAQPCSQQAPSGNAGLFYSAIYRLSPAISSGILDRSPSKFPQLLYCAHGCKNKRIWPFCNCFSERLSALDIVKKSLLPDLNPSEIAPQDLFGLLYFVFTAKLPKFIILPMFFLMHDLSGDASFPLTAFPTRCFVTLACFGAFSGLTGETISAKPPWWVLYTALPPPAKTEFFCLLFPLFFYFSFSKLKRATAACLALGKKPFVTPTGAWTQTPTSSSTVLFWPGYVVPGAGSWLGAPRHGTPCHTDGTPDPSAPSMTYIWGHLGVQTPLCAPHPLLPAILPPAVSRCRCFPPSAPLCRSACPDRPAPFPIGSLPFSDCSLEDAWTPLAASVPQL